jgi:hypothetical protein
VEQMCDAKSYLLKPRTLRSSKENLMHLIRADSRGWAGRAMVVGPLSCGAQDPISN